MTELATALHARGKQLSMAIPGLDEPSVPNGYDYHHLANTVDRIHIKGYDFHYLAGSHSGPIAPIGWLRGVLNYVEQTGRPDVFALGIANFAVGPGRAYQSGHAARLCGSGYATTTSHMSSCSYGPYEAGRAPHCMIDGTLIFFEDLGSVEEKVRLAHDARSVMNNPGSSTSWSGTTNR
jgi:hypothetical protein